MGGATEAESGTDKHQYRFTVFVLLSAVCGSLILDPGNLVVLLPAAVTGFIVNPAWNIWAGLSLLRNRREEKGAGAA